ncbi:rubrerythrin-like domain-containing protein [Halorussus lipolyticus]|nr:rubrerythrin-like domain-containing protein [Halorussus sp. DT80]
MSLRDPDYDSDADHEYECLRCGTTTRTDSHPGECDDCGTAMRNRGMPFE